jgi:hypothetical protein
MSTMIPGSAEQHIIAQWTHFPAVNGNRSNQHTGTVLHGCYSLWVTLGISLVLPQVMNVDHLLGTGDTDEGIRRMGWPNNRKRQRHRKRSRLFMSQTLRLPRNAFSTLHAGSPIFWYWTSMLIVASLFLNSVLSGGLTWDEPYEFDKVKTQLEFARDVLFNSTNWTFHSFPDDHAFYGIGAVLPAYALSYLIDIVWLNGAAHTFDRSYSPLLHLITFLCAIAGVGYTRRLVCLATGEREASYLSGITLLVTPFWIGYAFFDYKDIPVATGVVAATYYAAAYVQDGRSRTSCFFFLALLFLGAQKMAVVPLAMPACVAVLITAIRKPSARKMAILAVQATLFLLLLYVVTPPAWREPFAFAITNIKYMSAHTWGGCTLTAGQCIGRDFDNGQGYSVVKYLVLWYSVKLPIILWIGLLASIYLYIQSFRHARPCQHLIMAALAWPIFTVGLRNSTLYDGIRHTLFLVPLAVAMVFVIIPGTFWLQRRWWLACYFLFLLIDAMSLHPYEYVWFNEVARFFASEKNYETDYWGYSMREAAIRARDLQGPMDWVVCPRERPSACHLAKIFLNERFSTDLASVPIGATYLLVSITRANTQPPHECDNIDYVTRHQLLAPSPLHLAFVAKCRK